MAADRPPNKPEKLKVPDLMMIDEGIGESPNPSPLPDDPNVGRPGLNFNGLASWTFNTSNFIFDESVPKDFYLSLTLLDNWPSLKKMVSQIYEFASSYATSPPNPVGQCTSDRPCRISIRQDEKKMGRRPDEGKGMALNNCGKFGDWKFSDFEFKHILRTSEPTWVIEDFGLHAWSAAHWRRADSPYMFATFFFVPKLEVIDYKLVEDVGGAQCMAESTYDAWTCVKADRKEDLHSGCYYSGKCRPNYRKADGHFLGLDCEEKSGDPSKDFLATPHHFSKLQQVFVDTPGFRVPSLQWQREEMSWYSRRATSIADGKQFTEPKPKSYYTDREELLEGYKDWLLRRPEEQMPPYVRRLFFRQPRRFFKDTMRKSGAPREGFIKFEDLDFQHNPFYEPTPDDLASMDVPFSWSGNKGGKPDARKEEAGPEWNVEYLREKKPSAPLKTPPGNEVDAEIYVSKVKETSQEMAKKIEEIKST
jgi:hypothetical protein